MPLSPIVRWLLLGTIGLVIIMLAQQFGITGVAPTASLIVATIALLVIVERAPGPRNGIVLGKGRFVSYSLLAGAAFIAAGVAGLLLLPSAPQLAFVALAASGIVGIALGRNERPYSSLPDDAAQKALAVETDELNGLRRGRRSAVRSSHRFAIYFACVAFGGALGSVALGRAPLYALILAPAAGYAVYFLLPLALQLTGAATADLNVSHWFAWAVCGGLVFFWVGALAGTRDVLAEDAPRVGLYAALAWVALVVLVWLVTRVVRRRTR